jgi:hypothetical protein
MKKIIFMINIKNQIIVKIMEMKKIVGTNNNGNYNKKNYKISRKKFNLIRRKMLKSN